jgi:DNA-binding transcriptional LysR family regulator
VAFEELGGEQVVSFDSDLTIRREIDRALAAHNAEARVVMEFDNIETIKRAVEIGAGVAFLPEPTIAREVAAGTLAGVPLSTNELVRPLGILHRRGKELGVTVRRFIELLRADGKAARQEKKEAKEKQETVVATNGHERREVLVAS